MNTNLRVDAARLWETIIETAKIGGTEKGGVKRLTLTDLDAQVRHWLIDKCTAAGCDVSYDDMGNIFARRPGKDNSLPPIAIGSHLDTQPTGGKFDGIIGVLAGLEVLRSLNDAGIETNAPIELIDWTNEEGARFAPAMLSSGVFAGVFSKDYAYEREDCEGLRFGDELKRIGFVGAEACGAHKLAAHFELHIEQGPILEDEGKSIGIVTGVQGMRWYGVTVTGMDCHAGTTPMRMRQDALVAASKMIQVVQAIALAHGPDAVSTVGLIEARPNSRNVIPGEVFFSIDFRHPNDEVVAKMEKEVKDAFEKILLGTGISFTFECIWDSPAVHFDSDCIAAVERATTDLGLSARRIVSGAGHDSAYIAKIAPTTMIFVPCEKGISHNEAESAEPAHVAAGADVLLQAVLATDARLAQKHPA
ncbi:MULTISPECIES: M20 family metallo-hydrolase [unclassified Acidocella]|uniref:M20 family metallo-hydrolase n=1 Tax=unclassified Acidocella TaxID=2648610 RepID=UPI00028EF6BE|nr:MULTISPECIES: M20 family metallo-hydrolase [unclassified Acidocella]EKN00321.1 N-carbamoyl-L-amino acid amidohydrolase [Acidocella sp. MX-AZ02]WBO59903.1 M20 family metallo-hydrolase [Acidocella sp. MX-AZ03]